ncbi:MAG: LON peptidase substrate-binding domain-containing protein, partial [Planctomycetota bacterium]
MSTENPPSLEREDVEDVEQVEIPGELPVLPLRGALLYPYMVLPLHVGRGSSLKLVDETAVGPRLLAVVAQRDDQEEDPAPDGLYLHGTACRILRLMKLPDGNLRVLVQGIRRVRLDEFTSTDPYMKARATALDDVGVDSIRAEALASAAKDLFRGLVTVTSVLSEELLAATEAVEEPARLADFLAANLNVGTEEKQKVLETVDVTRRLEIVTELLTRELKVAEIQKEIHSKVQDEMGKKSREVFLREQMKAIQSELGDEDARQEEIEELEKQIAEARMPEEAEKVSRKELDRLARMHPSAAEYTVSRTYLDWMVGVPWSEETED